MKRTITEEYTEGGTLMKRTVVEEDGVQTREIVHPVYIPPTYPWAPNDYWRQPTITCGTDTVVTIN